LSYLVTPKVECVESKDNYARFSAEPLERGFGTTLGNTLRRVLLSSLLGAAVNWVKIEGIQHEFSTIPHVKEDATDFLLNVKAIRLRSVTKQPGNIFLEVEGERQVYASDLNPSADFEIANPDLYLATLDSAEAKLLVEFNVTLGKGYEPATHCDDQPIGVIPVDAIFTPVHKVNYFVEQTRVGSHTDYERLIIDVWTDGTISPQEAFIQSAEISSNSPFSPPLFKLPTRILKKEPLQQSPLNSMSFPWKTLNFLPASLIACEGTILIN